MAERELAILVKAVGAAQASKALQGVSKSLGNIGSAARRGASAAATNLTRLGVVAGVGLTAAVKTGIDDLATLEDATSKVDGAIRQLGLTGQVTSSQVATWANDIEASVQAAFDDKDITAATATLIRFGGVGPKNLRKAMVVMTDLAAKTGDVGSASTLLGKALADPEKAAGKLAKTGVVLTKQQQDQIKALVKAGKTEQAQAILLDLIAQKTKGAAAATAGPYRDALNELGDASEDARKALAIGFLPVIEKVADWLHGKLADQATLKTIQGFGTGLADAFDKLLGIIPKIPWDSVATSMRIAGAASSAILDAFVGLPPWVQTAVVTGWGLNKLTGGALGDIVGTLGAGLIKGVLGMNAGVVNINAAVVNGGAGGLPGAAAGAAGIGAGTLLAGAAITGAAALAVGAVAVDQSNKNSAVATGVRQTADVYLQQSPSLSQLQSSLAGVDSGINQIQANPLNVLVSGDALEQLRATRAAIVAQMPAAEAHANGTINSLGLINDHVTDLKATTAAGLTGVRDRAEANRVATAAAAARTAAATTAAGVKVAGSAMSAGAVAKAGGLAAAAAIRAKHMTVKVTNVNNNNISVRSVIGAHTVYGQYQKTSSVQRTEF